MEPVLIPVHERSLSALTRDASTGQPPLSNTVASQFNFAIGVVNVNAEAVNISIKRGQQSIDQRVISPGQLDGDRLAMDRGVEL